MNVLPLRDETCVVTGSTRGIGRATALQLAKAGANVILHGRAASERSESVLSRLREISSELQLDHSHGCCFGDFSKLTDYQSWVDEIWQSFGTIHHWVNNAGGDVLTGNWADRSLPEKLDYLWRVDVQATLMLSRAIGERMTELAKSERCPPGRFSLVTLGWDQAEQGMEGDSGQLFATTKGAIMSMTRSLAQTLAPWIRVNCVAPGWIQTQWGQQTSEYWNQRATDESLMGRWGQPEDVAAAVLHLCLPSSNFISGQILQVNGGFRYSGFSKQ